MAMNLHDFLLIQVQPAANGGWTVTGVAPYQSANTALAGCADDEGLIEWFTEVLGFGSDYSLQRERCSGPELVERVAKSIYEFDETGLRVDRTPWDEAPAQAGYLRNIAKLAIGICIDALGQRPEQSRTGPLPSTIIEVKPDAFIAALAPVLALARAIDDEDPDQELLVDASDDEGQPLALRCGDLQRLLHEARLLGMGGDDAAS